MARGRKKTEFSLSSIFLNANIRQDIAAIVLTVLAAVSLISLVSPSPGVLTQWLHDLIISLFGVASFVVPLALALAAVSLIAGVFHAENALTFSGLALGLLASLTAAHLTLGVTDYATAAAGNGGGLIGFVTSKLLLKALGQIGAWIVVWGLGLTSLVMIFNVPLSDIWRLISRPLRALLFSKKPQLKVNDTQLKIPELSRQPDHFPEEKEEPPKIQPSRAEIIELRSHTTPDKPPELPQEPESAPTAGVLVATEPKEWKLPPLSLLSDPLTKQQSKELYQRNAEIIEKTLAEFNIDAKVCEVNPGPRVTQYALRPAAGVKVSRIEALSDNLALALAARSIRIEAPVPGRSVIGIEIPNLASTLVFLKEVVASAMWQSSKSKLTVALGRDVSGSAVVGDLAKMPHLLIAGQTGSGKSVCINSVISSLLCSATPTEVRLLLIDPKRVELATYNQVPHLFVPVITDLDKIITALKWAVGEMERRYKLFASHGARNIDQYNQDRDPSNLLPYIVIIIDELADLMMNSPIEVENAICRIAQLARATGIHLVVATQRPSVEVVTGLIKANIPCRIAFAMASQVDSRTILDMVGAEKLLGRGDMLYVPPDVAKPIRLQGVFVADREVENLTNFWKQQGASEYHFEIFEELSRGSGGEGFDLGEDKLYDQAVKVVMQYDRASASLLQRRLKVGYARAARLIDMLEQNGIIGPYEGSKSREVLIQEPLTDYEKEE